MILLRHHWLMREARRRAGDHDVVIGVDNEGDLGGRGIQYVHYPMLTPVKRDPGHAWYGRLPLTLRTYHAVAARVTGYRAARMRTNRTLVNSNFIGAQVRALHGVETVTLYPPVPGDFPVVPWEARRNNFIAIGRLTPEKRIETLIAITATARATHPDVELHLVGTADDPAYARRVRRLVRDHDGWVFLHENVPRSELVRLVVQHRWGIHAMPDEHFGIAVAEMVRGGCVVFVPDGSGPAEIVGDAPALRFRSKDDAVTKIRAVLDDTSLQEDLRTRLAARQAHFTTERFVDRLREIVRHHLGSA
jgi:glycosyltransferase involved in cell wall biosynthesis